MEARNGILKTIEYRVRGPGRVEPFETVPLDLLDERWVKRYRASIPPILKSFSPATFPRYFVSAPASLSRCGTNATQS